MAEREGISLEELLDKKDLGEFGLRSWEEAGKKKDPKEVLRPDIAKDVAEWIKAIQHLKKNSQ